MLLAGVVIPALGVTTLKEKLVLVRNTPAFGVKLPDHIRLVSTQLIQSAIIPVRRS